jgi:hypothetical protein
MKDAFKRAPYTGPDRRRAPTEEADTTAEPKASGRLTVASRHAAIGDKLNTFRDYKEWVGRVRSTWDPGK